MSKITLAPLSGGQGSVEALNANFELIQQVINTLLSRDGTQPNHMEAALDMNSNRVYNLPNALNSDEPLTKGQFDALTDPPIAYVPAPHSHDWADITNEPTAFPPSAHTHPTSQVTDLDAILVNIESDITALQAEPTVFVQSAQPSAPVANDLWFW